MPNKLICISRLDYDEHRMHCWRVSIRRRGMRIVRNFSDTVWGGKSKALVAAKNYRDDVLRAIPPLTKLEYANLKRKNNKSGVTGVYRAKQGKSFSWVAKMQLPDGKTLEKGFSEQEFGFERAQNLAIQARKKMLRLLDGKQCFVPEHGKVQNAIDPKSARDTRFILPQLLTVRVSRYISPRGISSLNIRVSNGVEIKTKQFSENFHGAIMAYQLAVQTAGSWVDMFAGLKVRRQFEKYPACNFDQLPEDGIRFKARLIEKQMPKSR